MFTVQKSGDLSGVAKGLQRAVVQGQKTAAREVAKEGRRLILEDVKKTRPGGLRFGTRKLGVKTRVTAGVAASVVELYGSPAGPWTIVTKGTKAYTVKPKKKKVLAVSKGDVVGMSASIGRRPGRDYWAAAEPALDRGLFEIVEDAFDEAMSEAS